MNQLTLRIFEPFLFVCKLCYCVAWFQILFNAEASNAGCFSGKVFWLSYRYKCFRNYILH